jgi:hypothetical protein
MKASAYLGIRHHSCTRHASAFIAFSLRRSTSSRNPLDPSDFFSASTLGIQTPLPPRILRHSPFVALASGFAPAVALIGAQVLSAQLPAVNPVKLLSDSIL